MNIRTILAAIVLCFVSQLFAQNPENKRAMRANGANRANQPSPEFTIQGKIKDEQNKPLPFASIAYLSPKDSSIITGGITNEKGIYSLNLSAGTYIVKASFIGYQTYFSEPIYINAQNPNQPAITLRASEVALKEVAIVAEKSEMQFLMDKKVFTVGKDLTTKGNSVVDVLENVPSVQTDIEGNISLRGSGNLTILINGKPSAMTANGNTDILKFIPADQIEKIEVMTNPSAKYDAEGSVGMLNIVLKKERLKGFHTSISLNTGRPDNHSININLNKSTGKINLFLNGGIGYRAFKGENKTEQFFTLPDTTYFSNNITDRSRARMSKNVTAGIEVNFKKENQLMLSYRLSDGLGDNVSDVRYETFHDYGEPATVTQRIDNEVEKRTTGELLLQHTKFFKNKQHKLENSFRFSHSFENESSDIEQFGLEPLVQDVNNDETNRNFAFQSDYTQTIFKNIQLESGIKIDKLDILTDYTVKQKDSIGAYQNLAGLTNAFNYYQTISAAYLQLGKKFKKISVKAGLRFEHSDVSTTLVNSNLDNHKQYSNLFPSAFFTYKLGEKTSLQLNYSKRISRPHFWYLNPFYSFSDNRNIRSGNPDLDPEFGHNMEFGYLWKHKRQSFYGGVFGRQSSPTFQRVSIANENAVIYSTTINHGTNTSWGIETNWTTQPKKNITLTLGADGYYFNTNVNLPELNDVSSATYQARTSVRYLINKTTNVQLTANYNAKRKTVQGYTKARGSINFGLSKELWSNKASIGFNARDIFNTRQRRTFTETKTFTATSSRQWGAPWFTLNFTYYINKDPKIEAKNRRLMRSSGGGDMGE